MKDFNETRPEFVTSDNLWHLYECIRNMNTPYIKVKLETDYHPCLYVIENMTFDVDKEAKYIFDDMANMDVPYEQYEYLVLHLKRKWCDKMISRECRIRVNSYSCYDIELTAAKLLERSGITFATEEDMEAADLVKDIPATYLEEKPKHRKRQIRLHTSINDRLDSLRAYLETMDIWYTMKIEGGVKSITMAFEAPNCPGSRTESCIRFFENCAEVRCYYSEAGSEIFKKSAHKYELFRLLNFINARVHLEQQDTFYEPHIFLEPRFCVTEDGGCDITAITMINYKNWDMTIDTREYITGFCPSLLSLLAPFVFGVLEGKMTADEAIEGIKKDVLKEE